MSGERTQLGEFEQLVLLAVLQLGDDGHAIGIRSEIEERAERRVTRGALYATLDRLQKKGYLDWEVSESTPERGGIPRRRFRVTEEGLAAVRAARQMWAHMEEGLGELLGPR